MPRRLSEDPDKRRLQIFRRIYSNYYVWKALVEDESLHYLTVDGEDFFFHDLMVGIETLPPRQRQAFELHILLGMSEKEAAAEMGFKKWVTLVGQYSTTALRRMVEAYDAIDRKALV